MWLSRGVPSGREPHLGVVQLTSKFFREVFFASRFSRIACLIVRHRGRVGMRGGTLMSKGGRGCLGGLCGTSNVAMLCLVVRDVSRHSLKVAWKGLGAALVSSKGFV